MDVPSCIILQRFAIRDSGSLIFPAGKSDPSYSGLKLLFLLMLLDSLAAGYVGGKCERCAYGYYGSPHLPGGKCVSCDCNLAGSLGDACDGETGQCKCRSGSTGRDCSQCTAYRHVYINDVCTCECLTAKTAKDSLKFVRTDRGSNHSVRSFAPCSHSNVEHVFSMQRQLHGNSAGHHRDDIRRAGRGNESHSGWIRSAPVAGIDAHQFQRDRVSRRAGAPRTSATTNAEHALERVPQARGGRRGRVEKRE